MTIEQEESSASKLKSLDPDWADSITFQSAELRGDRSRRSSVSVVERSTRSSKLAASRLSELTINKLRIHSIGLVGREDETDLLKERLQCMIREADAVEADVSGESSDTGGLQFSKTKKELIFIKGFSGVGKSSLARTLQKEVNSTKNGFFAEGKFDLNDTKDVPYSGVAKAYSELIREMKRTDRNMLLGIGQRLCEELGPEVEPLTYLIPELEEFVTDFSTTAYSDGGVMDGMQERWKYSFRALTRLLAAHVKPLVIVIDDLQWADKGSLDLIKHLMMDNQNVNALMVIGCYRSNEVDETSELSTLICSMKEDKSKYGVETTEISIEGFGSREVNHMIMKMMDSDDEERTMDLAELCFQRTLGNPFFVIEFMSMLHREELISFNIGTMKWLYDVSKIEETTMSTANVVELLQSRMQQMPKSVQTLLSIAACFGPSFRVSILDLVWRNLSYVEEKGFEHDILPKLMEFIQLEMLIEQGSGDSYRWVHDKVQEAALTFVDVNKDAFRFEMGKVLYFNLRGNDLDDELFEVADLIGSGRDVKSADLASLFLKAAKKAGNIAAFASSVRYIDLGIQMLPNDHWSTNKSLTLDLYTVGAQVELAQGNVPETKKYCSAVLTREDIDASSKVPFRVVEVKRLSQVELQHSNAAKATLALLKDIGFNFTWNRSLVAVQALSSLTRTVKALKRQPKDFYLRLGQMDDKNRRLCELLNLLSQISVHTQEVMQLVLCTCHTVQLTLKHGLCTYSGAQFAYLGILAGVVFQTDKDAPLFREVALSTQNHYGRANFANTIYGVYGFCLAWSLRMDSLPPIFYDGYLQGMKSGEIDIAIWNLFPYSISVPFMLGKSIDQILDIVPAVALQMDDVKQTMQSHFVRCFWQMFLILQDPAKFEDPTVLKGEVHSKEDCDFDRKVKGFHDFAEFQLLLFFDHESAADRAIQDGNKFAKLSSRSIIGMIEAFHRGVSLYVAARRTKQRKYKGHANKIRKTIHKWKDQGNPNVVYYCMYLDAEQAALEGKLDEAETQFQNAIQFAARSGYLHHAALFNEQYGDFMLRERNDMDEAKYRLKEAMRYYKDWGAHGVVDRLKKSSLLT